MLTMPVSSKNRKLKILYLPAWYPHRYDNMFGLFIQKHAVATLPFCDISVLYILGDHLLTDKKYDVDYLLENGVPTLRVYFKKSNNSLTGKFVNAWRYTVSYLKGYAQLTNKTGKPDMTHVHVLTRAGIFALYLKKIKGIPYLVTEHWSRYLPYNLALGSYKGTIRRLLTKIVVKNAKAVTTVTENLKNAMLALGLKNNYYITPNVVDVHKFFPAETQNISGIKKIVHVSCFDEKAKNIKGIINVIEKIAKTRNDFTLQVIGDGIDYKEVVEYAQQTGLVNKVIFFEGLLINNALVARMRDAHFFLLFSNYENLPCTIVESLALGVPVLSTNVGGIKEHINKDSGLLIEPANEKQLEEAILNMLDNSVVFTKDYIRQYAVNNFSNEHLGNLFLKLYKKYLTHST